MEGFGVLFGCVMTFIGGYICGAASGDEQRVNRLIQPTIVIEETITNNEIKRDTTYIYNFK